MRIMSTCITKPIPSPSQRCRCELRLYPDGVKLYPWSNHSSCASTTASESKFNVHTWEELDLENTVLTRTIEIPIPVAEKFRLEHLTHAFMYKHGSSGALPRLSTPLQLPVITRNKADTEVSAVKSDVDSEGHKGMLVALAELFGKPGRLEMVVRESAHVQTRISGQLPTCNG